MLPRCCNQGGPVAIADIEEVEQVLAELQEGRAVALMCACFAHRTCHRTTVAEEAKRREPDLAVKHLYPPKGRGLRACQTRSVMLGFLLTALSVALSACSAATPSPTPRPTVWVSPSSLVQPSPEPTVKPTPTPPSPLRNVDVSDPADDLVDMDDNPVDGPGYVDVLRMRASFEGDELLVLLTLAGDVPIVGSDIEQLNYLVILDAPDGGSSGFDYWLSVENRSDGTLAPALDDWIETYHYDGPEYPGAADVVGDTITWRVPLDALRSPASLRLRCWVQRATVSDVLSDDFLPDAGWAELG